MQKIGTSYLLNLESTHIWILFLSIEILTDSRMVKPVFSSLLDMITIRFFDCCVDGLPALGITVDSSLCI